MIKREVRGLYINALACYQLAINSKINGLFPAESVHDLAACYGKHCTTEDAMDVVGRWFNWKAMEEMCDVSFVRKV